MILFRTEHSRRTLVPKVGFVSAPGGSPGNVFRPGGPIGLVTNRCVFGFDKTKRRFRLDSVHPGHTVDEVIEHTGFDFDRPPDVPRTEPPSAETLRLMREIVAPELAEAHRHPPPRCSHPSPSRLMRRSGCRRSIAATFFKSAVVAGGALTLGFDVPFGQRHTPRTAT